MSAAKLNASANPEIINAVAINALFQGYRDRK